MEFVGRSVRKDFKGFGVFLGIVKSYDSSSGFLEIVYEDGDSEELEVSEVASLLDGVVEDQSELTKRPSRVVRKPKKRRRFQIDSNSGNESVNLLTKSCLNSEGLDKTLGDADNFNTSSYIVINRNVDLNASCAGVDVNLSDGLDLNRGLDLNDELNLKEGENENLRENDAIDLNLDLNDVKDNWELKQEVSGDSSVKRERCFDLNMGLDDETKNEDLDLGGRLKENTSSRMSEQTRTRETCGEVEGTRIEGASLNGRHSEISVGAEMKGHSGSSENLLGDVTPAGSLNRDASLGVLDAHFVNNNSSSDIQMMDLPVASALPVHDYQGIRENTRKGKNNRKRRKLSDSVNSPAETVLRRSARRGRVAFSAQEDQVRSAIGGEAVNSALLSPAVSAVSEDQPTISGCEEYEERCILPPKLHLPPSSGNLNLDGIPVLDFFSVYAFLRSFSNLLFLSPFQLEDFVASLRSKSPNLLIDYIHVSLLQTLRKHLEFLSEESSPSASNCLRSLNWDLLDLITWPIFMVEYLLMHSSGMKPDFDLCRLNLFKAGYYQQPEFVKVEILRCLCDDVIEVEAIRSELNRRTLVNEPNSNMDSDRNPKFEASKRRRVVMDVSVSSCMTEEVIDETTDWNSDECWLCKMDGNLICCDGCPAAFHSRCVGVATSLLPEGDWYCPECVIGRENPGSKVGKSIRGAELLGIDPHGRLYHSSCGYLLVSDPCEAESSCLYYNTHDLVAVTEGLKLLDGPYNTILSAITKHWDVYTSFNGAKSHVESENATPFLESIVKGKTPATPVAPLPLEYTETHVKDETINEGESGARHLLSTYYSNIRCEVSELFNIGSQAVDSAKGEHLLANSEGLAEISQAPAGIKNSQKTELDCLKRSARITGKPVLVGDPSLTSSNFKGEQGNNIQSTKDGCDSCKTSTVQSVSWQCGTSYANFYSFARVASSVAGELSRKSSDKISQESIRSLEDLISAQLKAISNTSDEFHWSNIQNLNNDARKEKCGWCISCKVPDYDGDCLFVMNSTAPVLEGFTSDLLGLRSSRNKKAHLVDVMCHIICIEDRLHGLLLGPWVNPHFPKLWRKNFLLVSDVVSVKSLLLLLESNMQPRSLSAEWQKHVDSVATMGSASHVVTSSLRVPSKHVIGRKRSSHSDLEPHPSTNASSGLGLFWWRGGRLSRKLFNWKVMPRSLASKAARQGGGKKIQGILYPDNSDFAKRSKYVVWRASVETAVSVEQLALQVRELDANIRWDDIENTNHLLKVDKESIKSIRSFKKAIIRRKCSEGAIVKYLLDFGKRRFIPDIVAKHGSKLEDSSSGRKKYWLEESHVPLYLLKAFEEKKIAHKSNKMSSSKLPVSRPVMKKPFEKMGFSYLFSRAERSENYQCDHCKKDVLIREAVSCQYCKGFFHKRHVRKSSGAITAECTYTCHKCQRGKSVKGGTKKGKLHLQKVKKASEALKPVQAKMTRKAGKKKQPAQPKTKRSVPVVVPLRRSARKAKLVTLESKKTVVKKGKQLKSRKVRTKKPKKDTSQKKRMQVYFTYWLNGLLFSRKPDDERAMHFRSNNHLAPFDRSAAISDQPKCILCHEPEFISTLNYISCEICGDWYHGDAFGLRDEHIGNLIGFRCHKCRNRSTPICPHLHATISDEAKLDELENDAVTQCAEKESSALAFPNEVFLKQKSDSVEESKDLFSTDECSHKEEHAGTVPGSIQKHALDVENGQLPLTLEQRTGATHNSDGKKLGAPDPLMEPTEDSSDNILLATILVETESTLSKYNKDVSGKELSSLRHDPVNNGFVKTKERIAILRSVVDKPLVDSSEMLPQEAVVDSGELLDTNV